MTKALLALLPALLLIGAGQPVAAPMQDGEVAVAPSACSMASFGRNLPEGVRLTRVESVAAGPVTAGADSPNGRSGKGGPEVGAHCLAEGKFEERTGAAGKPYAIAFQLRIPERWNGRLVYQGGAGLDGQLPDAVGRAALNGSTAPVALARGFAVVSTDSGHEGQDAAFAQDQLARINFAYAAIGKVTLLARHLLRQTTGTLPSRTYFEGCSNGGREAMIAAQRYPQLFDGVVAGDPAFRLGHATVLSNFSHQTYRALTGTAPGDFSKLPRALDDEDLRLLSRGVLAQCDALDGAKDGLIFDHAACRFDPAVLQCRPGQSGGCLAKAKVDAIKTAFRGPLDRQGEPLASHWVYDAGVAGVNWREWQLGSIGSDGRAKMIYPNLIADTLARYFLYPPATVADVQQADAGSLLAKVAATAAMTEATATDMSSFSARGGRMLLVTGWSDPIFSPADLVAWYERLDADGRAAANAPVGDYARLFLVPGMNHCGGGPALDDIDALSALVAWVEDGKAPDRLSARGKSFPGVSRPICAYPRHAAYDGHGDVKDERSFTCR